MFKNTLRFGGRGGGIKISKKNFTYFLNGPKYEFVFEIHFVINVICLQAEFGGGMVCKNILTGIVSSGTGCENPRQPEIYTDIYFYKNWIKSKIYDANFTEKLNNRLNSANIYIVNIFWPIASVFSVCLLSMYCCLSWILDIYILEKIDEFSTKRIFKKINFSNCWVFYVPPFFIKL